MTKKEELLSYVEENLDNSNNLRLETTIGEKKEKCTLTIVTSKTRTAQIITENFDEELVGSLPNDQVIHTVDQWSTVTKTS